jgi:hypothetical protein
MHSLNAKVGAPGTFTKETPGTYDPATDTSTPPTTSTAAGNVTQIEGDPNVYLRLQLIESENPTLLFTPNVPGDIPALGWTIDWGGETLTVKDITPLAPKGIALAAKIVASRG